MEKNKQKLATIILLLMTIFLMGAIFYLGYLLTQTPDTLSKSTSSPVAPKKTKAQVATSEKFIALNTRDGQSISPSPISSPTPTPTATPFLVSPTLSPTTSSFTPTPTEIILAYNNPTITPATDSASPTISTKSATLSPTKIESLPSAGYISGALIIFGLAIFLIFYALVF